MTTSFGLASPSGRLWRRQEGRDGKSQGIASSVCFHSLLPQWLPLPLGPSSGPSSGCGSSFHRQPWLWDVDPATCSHYTSKPRSAGGFPLLLLSRLSQVPAFSFAILPTLFLVFLVAQRGKNPPAMQETQIRSLGWEGPLEKEMATHSSIVAWEISGTAEPGGLQSMGS